MSDDLNRCVWPLGECSKASRIEELEVDLKEQIEWVKNLADELIQAEAELKEQSMQYLSDTGQLGERIGELTEVLEAVDAWVEDLGYYADEGAELVPVFKKVKAVLGKGYK